MSRGHVDIEARPNSIAVLGFHDGSAGQIETWFEEVTGLHIACFIHESAEPFSVDIAAENKKRTSQRTSFPANGTFKGRPFLVTMDWAGELRRACVTKVLPLTPDNRTRVRQIELARKNGLELVS